MPRRSSRRGRRRSEAADAHGPDVDAGAPRRPTDARPRSADAAIGQPLPRRRQRRRAGRRSPTGRARAGGGSAQDRPQRLRLHPRRRRRWRPGSPRRARAGVVAFDTETTSLDPMQAELVGFSLAVAPGHAPPTCRSATAPAPATCSAAARRRTRSPLDEALAALKPLLEDPSVLKIGQNLKYDWLLMHRHGIDVAPLRRHDADVLRARRRHAATHGMDALAERWLGHAPIAFKEVAGSGKSAGRPSTCVDIERATTYAAEDADVTLRLWQVLKPRLAAEGPGHASTRGWSGRWCRCWRAWRSAASRSTGRSCRGCRASSRSARRALEDEIYAAGRRALQHRLAQAARRHPVRQAWACRAARRPRPASGRPPRSVLEELAAEGHELPRSIVDWRQLTKLKSTYTDALPGYINPADGARAHLLCAGRDHDRAALLVRAEPAEHPDPHRGGPQDPHRLRRRARQQADLGRLQPDRAARPRPCRRHPAAEGRPSPTASTSTP